MLRGFIKNHWYKKPTTEQLNLNSSQPLFYAPVITDVPLDEIEQQIKNLPPIQDILTDSWFVFKKLPIKLHSEELDRLIEVIKTKSTKFYLKL